MKNIVLIYCLWITICNLYSQENYSTNFGSVTQYEMIMEEFPNDPDAEAVVLYEIGQYRFYPDNTRGFLLQMTKTFKIKVLKEEGIKYANIEIPYYKKGNEFEEISQLEATTYNLENGLLQKVSFDKKNMFEEKGSDDIYVKKIALPDVRVGSVFEVKYQITTPFYFYMRKWEFQKKIPVLYSKLEYRSIPYYEYTYILRGTAKFDEFDSKVNPTDLYLGNLKYQEVVYNMGFRNIPAFRDETFIASEKDYMIAADFQLSRRYFSNGAKQDIISTWPALCDELIKESSFGKFIKNSEKEAKKIFPQLEMNPDGDDLLKLISITEYVKRNYNWNGVNSKFASEKLSEFLKKKQGSAANINLFLIGLLRAANLDVNPVIVSTRRNGAVSKTHPFLHFFNYVIAEVKIGDTKYLIDATESLLPYDELPQRCVNVEGLVVKPKSEEWIVTVQNKLALTDKIIDLEIDIHNRQLNVNATYETSGNDAYLYRVNYLGKEEDLKKYIEVRNDITIIDKMDINAYNNVNEPFVFSFNYHRPLEMVSDKIFINPFCNLNLSENPFKQESRVYPVDLVFLSGDNYEVNISIPDGYKVESLPKELNHESKYMTIRYVANVENENTIKVTAGYSFNQNMYQAKDYTALKTSVNQMLKHFSEMVILSPI